MRLRLRSRCGVLRRCLPRRCLLRGCLLTGQLHLLLRSMLGDRPSAERINAKESKSVVENRS